MIIENPDAFKAWLTSILEPLCDADPAALAKYVYALVKKDKPLEELREGMLDQLDVFLQHETKPFVDMLFKSLESQEYLKRMAEALPCPAEPEPPAEASPLKHATNGKEDIDRVDLPPPRSPVPCETVAGAAGGAEAPAAPLPPGKHRLVIRNKVPPRHPHHEQTLVKVLPLTELLEEPVDQPPRRRERRGDLMRINLDRRRRRSRSWERRGRRPRPHRDPDHPDRRRPISRSPSPRGRYRNRSPPPGLDRPISRSRSRSPVPIRDREHERERDRLRIPHELERDRMSRDRDHRERISRSRDRDRSRDRSRERSLSPHPDSRLDHNDGYNKRRCRDFDEKGYCMRGDLCQWDHGTDPVVLEDAALTRVLTIPPPVPEYNPLAPDIWMASGFPYAPPARELVPIPRVRAEGGAGVGVGGAGGGLLPLPPRPPLPLNKNFDYTRLGPARPPLPAHAGNCSLEVKKVPRGLNEITHLNNHFAKFGKIVNIQVCFEGDPEAALITFSNPTEANVAYKSTEAVLNNRFIKVFWHNPENKQENMAPGGQQNKQLNNNKQQHPMSHNKVLINRDNIKATADNKQLQIQQEKANQLASQANGATVKKDAPPLPAAAPPQPAEKSKQVMEMHRRAQALLETQIQQQLLLIQRLEAGNVTGPQKAALMEAINSAQEGIEKLRKELVAYNKTIRQMQEESVARSMSRLQLAQANAKKPKTREEAQKEILDAELDMFTKQQEGHDVTDLVKKIAELRRQMALQFPHHAIRRTHSRGGRFNTATRFTRGAAAAKVFNNQVVDHRPRALLISGFESDDLESLIAHFAQFGEICGKEVDLAVPQLTLQYKARNHAEQAALRGRNYNDRTLSITWVTSNKPLGGMGTTSGTQHNGDTHRENKEPETPTEVSEDSLLRFDEEEEDDAEEDRSWRR